MYVLSTKGLVIKSEGVSKFRYILFSYPSVKNAYNETKPRLSQAKALPYHKNFVSLWHTIIYMSAKIHFRDYNPKQTILFPQRLDKDIADNDPVRVVDAVIDNLKLENFRKLYKERGRSPYHPKMMLKAVIYGYMNNLYSCRKIESSLQRDIHFIWLAG